MYISSSLFKYWRNINHEMDEGNKPARLAYNQHLTSIGLLTLYISE